MVATGLRWPLVGRNVELARCLDALSDDAVPAVVVHGPAGVGKSRLADEVLGRLEAAGRSTRRARASVTAGAIPLGALVHLLPAGHAADRDDPLTLFRDVAAELAATAGDGRRPVVLVDDLQWLDPSSAALLHQLVDGGAATLVGTVRSGEHAADTVAGLWRRGDITRVDLDLLSRGDVEALLQAALGGPVHHAVVGALAAASGGNPLFVRELVLSAQSRGDLVERRGVWWLEGTMRATPRLAELIGDRMRRVTGPAHDVLEVLAVWESVGLAELDGTFGTGSVETLERAGLVEVRVDGRRRGVGFAHPLYGEVLRAEMPTMTRHRLLLEGADRIARWGGRRRTDPLHMATARLEAVGSADADLLLQATRIARAGHDFGLVDRLTAAAAEAPASAELVLLRSEALHELRRYEEVERLLAPVTDGAAVDVQLVAMRVRNLMWGLDRAEEALALNRLARQRATDEDVRDELITDEGLTLLYSGRPGAALTALEQMSPAPSPRARVLRAIARVPALMAIGRCETALAEAAAAHREHRRLGEQTAIAHPGVHVVYRVQGLLESGRLAESEALAATGYEYVAHGPPLGRDWFALGLGRAALLAGRPRTACRWLAEAAELSSSGGTDGPNRLELSLLAVAHAVLGDTDQALAVAREVQRLPPAPVLPSEQELGPAWAEVARRDIPRARDLLAEAADQAAATGHRSSEAWLRHDLVRLGDAVAVAGRLTALAEECEGDLVPLYAEHARAAAARDGDLLDAVSARFEELGMLLFAAEAATAASEAHRRAMNQRAGNAALTRARALAAQCEGANTPGLLTAEAVVPLTQREREVGVLAATGMPSRAIAEQLYLSVRTVENHLQHVYAKLGVAGRADLAEALSRAAGPD